MPGPSLTVIVPSHNRPVDLRRCLAALASQQRSGAELIVVLRQDDAASHAVVAEANGTFAVRTVIVTQPGVIAAMNAVWLPQPVT